MATKQTSELDHVYTGDANLPLYDFFIELQQNGFSVTPKQISDATQLINQFASQVEDESELANYLTPLFANNQEEQLQFNEIFTRHFHIKKRDHKIELSPSKGFKNYLRKHWWKYLIGLLLFVLVALYVVFQSVLIITPSFRLVDKNNPESSDFIEESFLIQSKDTLEVDVQLVPFFGSKNTDNITHHVLFDWGDGSKNALTGEHQYEKEGIYEMKAYVTFYKNKWWKYYDTVRQKINVCNQQSQMKILNSLDSDSIIVGQAFSLKADIIGPKPDSIIWYQEADYLIYGDHLDTIIVNEGNYYFSCKAFYGDRLSPCHIQSKIRLNVIDTSKLPIRIEPSLNANPILSQKRVTPFWYWLTGGLTLLTLALTILFSSLWNRSKRKANQEITLLDNQYQNLVKTFEGSKPPLEVPFRSKNYLTLIEPDLQIIARQMRKRMSFDENVLNIHATIQKSIHSGGLFQPVLNPRTQQSEFLFLIDESNKNSLQVKLIQYLIEILVKQNVLVDIFYFRETPLSCYNTVEINGISLEKLSTKFGNHVFVFCGKGDQLLYEHYPIFNQDILQILSRWRYKAILTPVSFLDWGNKELNILYPQMPIVPFDTEGLISLLQVFFSSNQDIFSSLKRCSDEFYSCAQIDFENIDELDTYCNQFEWANFKINGNKENILLQWLAAMAVYPKIKWEIMLAIGKAILNRYGQSSELNYSQLLLLTRIKWVSDGQFPDYTRLDLLKMLKPENEVLARETILELLNEITIEELNSTQFAFEEKEIQRVTNEFNLYAFDSVKYERYKNSKETFEKLWKENKLQDSPAKVYFKNPTIAWQNLIQDKDDDVLQQKATMPIEKYFIKPDQINKPQNKLYYYLTILSSVLLIGSLLALMFFWLFIPSNSNKFSSFFEPKPIEQKISFGLNNTNSILSNKVLNCFVDTVSFELSNSAIETRSFTLNDSLIAMQIVVGEKTVLDTMMKFEFDAYTISINETEQMVKDSNLRLTIIRPDNCNDGEIYMSEILKLKPATITKDSTIQLPRTEGGLQPMLVSDCLNTISFGSSVDPNFINTILKLYSQAGLPSELKIVSPSDYPIQNNEIQIYVKAKNEIVQNKTAQYDITVLLSNECELNKPIYQKILESEKESELLVRNLKFTNIGRSARQNSTDKSCVNYITPGKKVDQNFVTKLISTFKKSGISLIQKPKVEHTLGEQEILIYYYSESCNPSVSISLNGLKNVITVNPLQKVKIAGTYSISNIICENCIQQLMIGLESKPISCIYNGIPSICPSSTKGMINAEMAAPAQPGNYDLYMNNYYEMNCELSNYKGQSGRMAKKIGTLIVRSESDKVELNDTTTIIYSRGKAKNRISRSIDQSTKVIAVKFPISSGTAYSWSLSNNTRLKYLSLVQNRKESINNFNAKPGGLIYDVYYFRVNGAGRQNLVFEFGEAIANNQFSDTMMIQRNVLKDDNKFILDIEIIRGNANNLPRAK